MKIVSISTNYPNPYEPGLGLFVRSRLQHMAALAEMVVVAPLPAIDYSNPRRRWFRNWRGPRRRADSAVEVLHPRWLYPPGGTSLNAVCMFLRLAGTLMRLRPRFRFDWIDAHFGYPEGVSAALLAWLFRCPFSITMRGNEPMFAAAKMRGRMIRWAVRRASAVLTVSNDLRRFAVACGVDPARAFTVPNGVDREVFTPRDRDQCRAGFGMAPDRLVIACAGELIEAKGHHLVLEALRELARENVPVDLYLAGGVARGGAPFAGEIERLIAEWGLGGRVRMTGWLDREHLANLMSAADVFCLASYTEGWPNVVNEALACGAPVVASRVGAVPEMIPEERYGFVVPPRDPAALAAALRRALQKRWDRAAIAEWGRARCWDDVAREVVDLLTGLGPHEPAAAPCDSRQDRTYVRN